MTILTPSIPGSRQIPVHIEFIRPCGTVSCLICAPAGLDIPPSLPTRMVPCYLAAHLIQQPSPCTCLLLDPTCQRHGTRLTYPRGTREGAQWAPLLALALSRLPSPSLRNLLLPMGAIRLYGPHTSMTRGVVSSDSSYIPTYPLYPPVLSHLEWECQPTTFTTAITSSVRP